MHILKVERAEKLGALRENPYFENLSQADLEHLADCTSLRAFERAETIFFEGDACSNLHIQQTGCSKLYRLSPQGRQYIVRLAQERDTFNEVSVFDGGTNPVNAEALEAGRIWVTEADCLRRGRAACVQGAEQCRRT